MTLARTSLHLPLVGPAARLSLLYSNDFDSPRRQGLSQGPQGEGVLAAAADAMVPFHYTVVVDTLADGTRAARFPTRSEQPGGGQFYSWFASYVSCRAGLVEGDRLYAWTVHLPRALRLEERCSYHENRHVFAIGIENRENHLGLRFADDHTLVWTVGVERAERTIAVVPLRRAVRPGEALWFTAAVRWKDDAVAFTVDADDGLLAASTAPTTSLSRASVAVLLSGGNTVGDDHDASLFCRLSGVRVHAVEAAPAVVVADSADDALLPPAFLHDP